MATSRTFPDSATLSAVDKMVCKAPRASLLSEIRAAYRSTSTEESCFASLANASTIMAARSSPNGRLGQCTAIAADL